MYQDILCDLKIKKHQGKSPFRRLRIQRLDKFFRIKFSNGQASRKLRIKEKPGLN